MSEPHDERQPGELSPEEEAPDPTGTPEERDRSPEEIAKDRDRLMERLMRITAEYENFRRRVGREQVEWTARAVERLVVDLLPALDSFDRALVAAGDAKDASSVVDGMILVHKQLLGALKTHGVEPFDAVGEPFDPNLHDAFMSRPAGPGETPGTIIEEFVKGYRMGERTIRPTKGIVAGPPGEIGAVEEE